MAEDKTKRDTRSIPKEEIEWALSILKTEYEKKLGITIKIEADCIIVCDKLIEFPDKKYPLSPGVKEPVSLKVITRIFDISSYNDGFTFKTLSIMVHFLGYKDWDDFVDKKSLSKKEFGIRVPSDISSVDPSKLDENEIIKLELAPDKYSVLKHLDDFFHFEVIEMKGMNKEVGTEFWTPGFEIVKDSDGNEYIKLTDHGYGWFQLEGQKDLEKIKDYFIL